MAKPGRRPTSRMHRSRSTRPCSVSPSPNPSLSRKRGKVKRVFCPFHLFLSVFVAFLRPHVSLGFYTFPRSCLCYFPSHSVPPSSQILDIFCLTVMFFSVLTSCPSPISFSILIPSLWCPVLLSSPLLSTCPPHQQGLISVWHFVIVPSYHTHTHQGKESVWHSNFSCLTARYCASVSLDRRRMCGGQTGAAG